MKEFNVVITETLSRKVAVMAKNPEEAKELVSDMWHNSEYILDAEDFVGVKFECEENSDDNNASECEVINISCPHCKTKDEITRKSSDMYMTVCNHCGELVMLCQACPLVNEGCDWSEKGCYFCSPYNFLKFLCAQYNGALSVNSNKEYCVDLPLASGRSVNVTYETDGLDESEKYYNIRVFCSEQEAETEKFKDNPVALSNSYKNIKNVFRMIKTLFRD